jgi:hypothetical protein
MTIASAAWARRSATRVDCIVEMDARQNGEYVRLNATGNSSAMIATVTS